MHPDGIYIFEGLMENGIVVRQRLIVQQIISAEPVIYFDITSFIPVHTTFFKFFFLESKNNEEGITNILGFDII